MRQAVIAFPLAKPPPISCERWHSFVERWKMLPAMRQRLEEMEGDWEAERDDLLRLLAGGAEIEHCGQSDEAKET